MGAYSAGANPSGLVNPYTLKVLRDRSGIDASDARSKSWQEFENVKFDFVITLCDKARETCPVWPGQPIIAHWGVEDPAAFAGSPEETERFSTILLGYFTAACNCSPCFHSRS